MVVVVVVLALQIMVILMGEAQALVGMLVTAVMGGLLQIQQVQLVLQVQGAEAEVVAYFVTHRLVPVMALNRVISQEEEEVLVF
jgi:hypothetical protein